MSVCIRFKPVIIIIIITIAVSFSSCGVMGRFSAQQAGNGGDNDNMVIPPDSTNSGSIVANKRNIDNSSNIYQQSIYNLLYQEISEFGACIDFDVDESLIYMIHRDKQKKYEVIVIHSIDAIDSEGQSGYVLETRSVNDDRDNMDLNAITVRNGRVYAYDSLNGDILQFDVKIDINSVKSTGNGISVTPEEYVNIGIEGLNARKMRIDDSDRIFILGEDESGQSVLYMVDLENPESRRLIEGLPDTTIQDFCLKDENTILIRFYPEKLGLYHISSGKIIQVGYMPDSAGLIEFGSEILYYASGIKLGISHQNRAAAQYDGSQGFLGRISLDEDFVWSADPSDLGKHIMGDISIPFWNWEYQHAKMAQNSKYIFFMDYSITVDAASYERMLYRIVK